MKTNSKWMTMAAVLGLTASLAVAAPTQGEFGEGHGRGHHGHGRGHKEFGAAFANKLNLTDAQKQQMKDIRQQFREQNKAFFESSRTTFEQFREAKKAGDQAKLDALKPAMEAQRAQMKQLRDQQKQRVLSILTPEQRTQYEAMKAEREAKRAEWQKNHPNAADRK